MRSLALREMQQTLITAARNGRASTTVYACSSWQSSRGVFQTIRRAALGGTCSLAGWISVGPSLDQPVEAIESIAIDMLNSPC
jgi:hypothetical protein